MKNFGANENKNPVKLQLYISCMFFRKLSILFILLLLKNFSGIAQEIKDTVYFDTKFSICEEPVAAYYRVCTLNKTDTLFYKGEVI